MITDGASDPRRPLAHQQHLATRRRRIGDLAGDLIRRADGDVVRRLSTGWLHRDDDLVREAFVAQLFGEFETLVHRRPEHEDRVARAHLVDAGKTYSGSPITRGARHRRRSSGARLHRWVRRSIHSRSRRARVRSARSPSSSSAG